MAYVLVQHLDPTHKSLLADLLARATRMDVREAREGMVVEANHVYIIAPNTDLTLEQDSLRLVPQTKTAGQHLSIDTFLASLAENAQHQAIGVILLERVPMGHADSRPSKSAEASPWRRMPHRPSILRCRRVPLLPGASISSVPGKHCQRTHQDQSLFVCLAGKRGA